MSISGVNLIPSENYVVDQLRRRAYRWGVICGLAALAVLGGYGIFRVRVQHLDSEVQQLRVQVSSMTHWEQEIAPLVDELRAASAQWQASGQLVDEPDWPAVLGEIADAAGSRVLITDLSAAREERAAGTRAATSVSLGGLAEDSAELVGFMERLSHAPSLQSLGLDMSRQTKQGPTDGLLEFKLKLTPR